MAGNATGSMIRRPTTKPSLFATAAASTAPTPTSIQLYYRNNTSTATTTPLSSSSMLPELDARTQETAATLIEGFAGVAASTTAIANAGAVHDRLLQQHHHHHPPMTHHSFHHHHHHHHDLHHQRSGEASILSSGQSSTAEATSTRAPTVLYSSIGLGIDPDWTFALDASSSSMDNDNEGTSNGHKNKNYHAASDTMAGGDATQAALKAVRDALERGVFLRSCCSSIHQDHNNNSNSNNSGGEETLFQLHVKLGVPSKRGVEDAATIVSAEPMSVDLEQVMALLPSAISALPIQVEVGGLLILAPTAASSAAAAGGCESPHGGGTGEDSVMRAVCTAVACISLQKILPRQSEHPQQPEPSSSIGSPISMSTAGGATHHHHHNHNHAPSFSHLSNRHLRHPPSFACLDQEQECEQDADTHHTEEQDHEQDQHYDLDEVSGAVATTVTATSHRSGTLDTHPQQQQQLSLQRDQLHEQSSFEKQQQQQQLQLPLPPKKKHCFEIHKYEQEQQQYIHEQLLEEDEQPQQQEQRFSSLFPSTINQGLPNLPDRLRELHHSTSIEMLARISAEIHDQQPSFSANNSNNNNNNTSSLMMIGGAATRALETMAAAAAASAGMGAAADSESVLSGGASTSGGPNNYNYKKLPPGVTPKNNKRLFVKHNYKDYSQESPLPEEFELLQNNNNTSGNAAAAVAVRTPNAAFPLKLHEILTQIEAEGYDSIIGWMPHGRSFKIHKHKEFVETILPKYFVMTKKSSFLRQLNLYGFNRLSGIGPDQGSYYHEKFLRGLKFLSRRMQRQKVNGNGIRAAGNPDEEPILTRFPTCPPQLNQQQQQQQQREEEAQSEQQDCFRGQELLQQQQQQRIREQQKLSSPILHALPPPQLILSSQAHRDSSGEESNSQGATDSHDAILRNSSGFQVSFPLKLQRILDKLEAEGCTGILSWLSHGRAFLVHDPDRFVTELMPVYFNQTKYSSFQRQLHMYNFQRITAGRDKGAYHHPNFQRGKPQLSLRMQRTRVNGKGTRRPGNPEAEPNLYEMEPLPGIVYGTKIDIPVDFPIAGGAPQAMDDSGSCDDEP